MHITRCWKHIQVDEVALRTFLSQEVQMPASEIEHLTIHFKFCVSHEDARIYRKHGFPLPVLTIAGCYDEQAHEIDVYLLPNVVSFLMNSTLLHELDHYRKHGYVPGEHRMPYWRRPSEKAANAFAWKYRRSRFVSLPGEPLLFLFVAFLVGLGGTEWTCLTLLRKVLEVSRETKYPD